MDPYRLPRSLRLGRGRDRAVLYTTATGANGIAGAPLGIAGSLAGGDPGPSRGGAGSSMAAGTAAPAGAALGLHTKITIAVLRY